MNAYEQVNSKIQEILQRIESYALEEQIEEIKQINKNFSRKVEDFHREGRKLNIGVIGRVKLHTGPVGDHSHGPPAAGIGKICAGIAENLKIMVVAGLQNQGLVIGGNILSDGLGDTEVHGRSCHSAALAGGDALSVRRGEEPGGHGKNLFHGFRCLVVTSQVKVTVIGQVKHCVPIRHCVIYDPQPVVF